MARSHVLDLMPEDYRHFDTGSKPPMFLIRYIGNVDVIKPHDERDQC